jgi:transcription initiation factor TFIID subunit 6
VALNPVAKPQVKVKDEPGEGASDPLEKADVDHVLTKELQLYYDSVTDAVIDGSPAQKTAVVASLSIDSGLQQLVPYLSLFVSDKVTHNLRNLDVLLGVMQMVGALLRNKEMYLDPYIHQLMPAILTCIVGKRLCTEPTENHWKLRDYAASLAALACSKFGSAYITLQPRITKTLISAFINPSRPMTTHYGAVVGLAALGPHTIHTLLLPNLKAYMTRCGTSAQCAHLLRPHRHTYCVA